MQFLVLGYGFTGERVARLLTRRGYPVLATTTSPRKAAAGIAGFEVIRMDVREPETLSRLAGRIEAGVRVLHSIPIVESEGRRIDPTPLLLAALGERAARIVYLSTTGVYGETLDVDENTPTNPRSETGRLRVAAENAVLGGAWKPLILRPAAIYGPGRGVHESIRKGSFRLAGDGGNMVSRIHVEDLAALAGAALLSDLTGTFPVADEAPCTSREMAEYCARLVGRPVPPSAPSSSLHHTRRANRRVDGSAVFRRLGVRLRYPTYTVGVPASLRAADCESPDPQR